MMLSLLLNQLRHETRPASLMTRAEARAVIAVKVFMEWNVIAPVRVVLESFIAAEESAIGFGWQIRNTVHVSISRLAL